MKAQVGPFYALRVGPFYALSSNRGELIPNPRPTDTHIRRCLAAEWVTSYGGQLGGSVELGRERRSDCRLYSRDGEALMS